MVFQALVLENLLQSKDIQSVKKEILACDDVLKEKISMFIIGGLSHMNVGGFAKEFKTKQGIKYLLSNTIYLASEVFAHSPYLQNPCLDSLKFSLKALLNLDLEEIILDKVNN